VVAEGGDDVGGDDFAAADRVHTFVGLGFQVDHFRSNTEKTDRRRFYIFTLTNRPRLLITEPKPERVHSFSIYR